MVNGAVWCCAAAGLLAGVWMHRVGIDVAQRPPEVVCDAAWVRSVAVSEQGLEVRLFGASPDLLFAFFGAPVDVEALDWRVYSVEGVLLGCGVGEVVPLGSWPEAEVVCFSSAAGAVAWEAVSEVRAEVRGLSLAQGKFRRGVARGEEATTVSAMAQSAAGARAVGGFTRYELCQEPMVVTVAAEEEGGEPTVTTNLVSSLNAMMTSGDYEPNTHAISATLSGTIYVEAGTQFRVGADDSGSLTVGGAVSSVEGEHALQWGNTATVQEGGYVVASAAFASVGGPYAFAIEGLENTQFYRQAGTIPQASFVVSPTQVTVPWGATGPIEGSASYSGGDSDIETAAATAVGSFLVGKVNGFTVDALAFLAAGAQEVTGEVIGTQRYEHSTGFVEAVTNRCQVIISPSPTGFSLSPTELTVSNAGDGGVATGVGEGEPHLTYTLVAPETGPVLVEDGTVRASAEVLALRDQCLASNISTNVTWKVDVAWRATYQPPTGGAPVEVAAGSAPLTVSLVMDSKKSEEDCRSCCAMGTQRQVDAGCVSFRQAFGRTPLLVGMPEGALVIEEMNLSDKLFTPAVLRYDHPMLRRLDVARRRVEPPFGKAIAYDPAGMPTGIGVARNSRLVRVEAEEVAWHEVFADRSRVVYDASGTAVELVSPAGVRATVDELGIVIERDGEGRIERITSVADGELAVEVISPTAYRVVWRDVAGDVVKVFEFAKEGERTLRLVDGVYPVRWTWEEALHDFAMTEGEGPEAATTSREVSFNQGQVTVTRRTKRGEEVASEETEVLDSANGNAVIGRTRGGRTTLAATRVTEGNGLGRRALTTDELGAQTAYTYDAQGRTLTETRTGAGETRVVTYTYGADPLDRRPQTTVEQVDGEVVRSETFEEALLPSGVREETEVRGGLETVRRYYDVESENTFEAGRLWQVVRPDGRMSEYGYDEETLTETVTEGVVGEEGALALVAGKSTRQKQVYDLSGNVVRVEREAWIGGAWVPLTWETRTYSAAHKHLGSSFSNGLSNDSRWNCTGPLWERETSGIVTTNSYNTLKQMVASTRYGSHGEETRAYTYDAAGRVVREERNGLVTERAYDLSGRLTSVRDEQGRVTSYAYPNEQTVVETLPGGGTRMTVRDALGRVASVTGSAVTAEYHTYGANWERVAYGSPESARWVKRVRDVAGRVVREERGGANGSVLVTENTYNAKGQLVRVERTGQAAVVYGYNAWGDRVSTQVGDRVAQEESAVYVLVAGEPWLEQVRQVGTQVTRSRVDAEGRRQVVTDARGNQAVVEVAIEGADETTTVRQAGVANAQVTVARDGVQVSAVDAAGVETAIAYDALKRPVAQTDGRGNVTARAYDALGQLAAVTDGAGAVTAYGYDEAGRLAAVTNALGNVVNYGYNARGQKVAEGGAVYPVQYGYDAFGQKVTMETFRDEAAETGDVTTWVYDEATGAVVAKTYADGRGVTYTLTDLGQVATRTDARGIVTTYTYNLYGDVTAIAYSDGTPGVSFTYDSYGRQASATDAAGTTLFAYNDYGELVSEAISGLYTKTLTHHYDSYGRDAGYSVNGARRTTLGYDGATGRLATLNEGGTFTWGYLPGSNLKSSLTYPNGLTAAWSYEPARDLLTQVVNAQPDGTVISSYTYTNDLLGRRTSKNTAQYGYNVRDELISADEVSYAYDDIGNRTIAEGKSYTANNLNQYTAIDDFTPTYDLDGNQTTVKTATGIWQVEYNAENRPVRWTQGAKVITMAFDRMGRRVSYREMNGSTQLAHTVFLYNGYLCIQQLFSNEPWNVYKEFIWDPTEPVATRPLAFRQYGKTATFLMHDGNKNVTDVVTVGPANTPVAHYDYAPFGAATLSGIRASDNPFRFSSEFADASLGLVYYNYRHYNPTDGRWTGRDRDPSAPTAVLQEKNRARREVLLYSFSLNSPLYISDALGLDVYLIRGGDGSIPFISNELHYKVCVDTWRCDSKTKCMVKGEKECFSFGLLLSLKPTLPGQWLGTGIQFGGLRGGVQLDSPTGTIVESFSTSCRGDKIALEELFKDNKKQASYSFLRHNCQTYSRDRFERLRASVEGMLPPISDNCKCPAEYYLDMK